MIVWIRAAVLGVFTAGLGGWFSPPAYAETPSPPEGTEEAATKWGSYEAVFRNCNIEIDIFGVEALTQPNCQAIKRNVDKINAVRAGAYRYLEWLRTNGKAYTSELSDYELRALIDRVYDARRTFNEAVRFNTKSELYFSKR